MDGHVHGVVVGLQPNFPQVGSLRLGAPWAILWQPQEACTSADSGPPSPRQLEGHGFANLITAMEPFSQINVHLEIQYGMAEGA